MVSCGGPPLCWMPDTTCLPRKLSEDKHTGISYLASDCNYYNYGYVKYVKDKRKPKRFCYLNVFVESDRDYRIKLKRKKIKADRHRIKGMHKLSDSWGNVDIFQGVNMLSFPMKTCAFSNDTINVIITNEEGDLLMNTCILADESFSEPFQLLGTDSTYIDSLWYESMQNRYAHGKLPKHSTLEREAVKNL